MNEIKKLRKELGMTQQGFAERYGIPKRTVENWESGKSAPVDWAMGLLQRVVREDIEERERRIASIRDAYGLIKPGFQELTEMLDAGGDLFDEMVFSSTDPQEVVAKIKELKATDNDYSIQYFKCDEDGELVEGSDFDTVTDFMEKYEEENEMKKYWLDCESTGNTQFALYEKTEDEETCILKFDFEDIEGLKELEEAGKIGEGYELIDKYIEEKLGFLPEYEVG